MEFRLIRNPFDRLFGALLDPARCDRAILLLLIGYAVSWTLYGSIARSSQDLHPDMTELIAWSRDLRLGYLKHPPLAAWLVRLWFSIVPSTDLSFYLLAMLMPTIALWIVWRLSAAYLELDKRVLAIALLTLVPFYNFHALKFNANTVLLPAWAATTLWFLRSYKTHSILYSVLTGIGMGLCLLGKYWSVFLIAGLVLAALFDSRRATYFRSAAPWVTVIVAMAVFAPHVFWFYQHDFVPLQYAFARHTANSFAVVAAQALAYFAGSFGYVAVPIIVVLAISRHSPMILREIMWPSDSERRLIAVAFWGPLLLPIAGALVARANLSSIWSMPAWTLFPVLLLSPPTLKVRPIDLRRILTAVVSFPLAMIIVAPAIAVAIQLAGVSPPQAHARLLATKTESAWRQVTARPLRFVGCDVANEVVAYAADRPHALPSRSFHGDIADQLYAEAYHWPATPSESASIDAQLTDSGMALVCSADEANWVAAAAQRAARDPASRRIDIEIARNFLGIAGRPQHYVVFIIPPPH